MGRSGVADGELIGLVATVALLGIGIGAIGTLVVRRGRDDLDRRRTLGEAWERWLAARWSLSRTSGSLVVAFRALALTVSTDRFFQLRQNEAQRTRDAWCAAMTKLEQAEAVLVVRDSPAVDHEALRFLAPVSPADLQNAIDGSANDFLVLKTRLRDEQRRAIEVARCAVARAEPEGGLCWTSLAWALRFIGAIADRWAEAPKRR